MELSLPPGLLDGPDVALPFAHPAYQSLVKAGDLKRNRDARVALYERCVPDGVSLCRVEQVHSRTVVDVSAYTGSDDPARERFVEEAADGMVSAADGPWLAVTVGDCLPLFLIDERSGSYGLLHSGWKGTGILEEAIGVMERRFGTAAADVHVLAGAGIHACCYEVSPERGEAFSRWGSDAVIPPGPANEGGRPHLDLYNANRHLAEKLGIATFTQVTNCTCCDDRFGSYRRQGGEAYTSMIALLGPREE